MLWSSYAGTWTCLPTSFPCEFGFAASKHDTLVHGSLAFTAYMQVQHRDEGYFPRLDVHYHLLDAVPQGYPRHL